MGQSTSLHAALPSCPSAFPPTKALADPSTVLTPQLAFQPLPHALNLPPGWLLRWSWWCNGVRTPQPGCRDPQWAPPWPSTSSPKSPTSQREGPVSSCQPYTVGGLLLGLFHPPPQNASDQRARLGWGGGGVEGVRRSPTSWTLLSCCYLLPLPSMVAAQTRGLGGNSAPGAQEVAWNLSTGLLRLDQ